MSWAKNVSELGEWGGNRLSAFQEYSVSPDNFVINPAECEDLDDEEMERIMNGQTAYAAW
jgi:hypothetical protein